MPGRQPRAGKRRRERLSGGGPVAVKKTVFLRDDDVTAADPKFLRVFKFLLSEKVPTVYAVIPSKIKPGLIRLLKEHPEAGHMFETVQHGLSHCDHSGNPFIRQEFGPVRPFLLQLADIRTGRDLMKKNFGSLFIPAFVPPFHMYNSDTVKAVGKAGLKAFSASKTTGAFYELGLVFLPALVNVNDYDLDLKAVPLKLEKLKEKTPFRATNSRAGGRGVLPSLRPERIKFGRV